MFSESHKGIHSASNPPWQQPPRGTDRKIGYMKKDDIDDWANDTCMSTMALASNAERYQ
jgi:hypothetical protein